MRVRSRANTTTKFEQILFDFHGEKYTGKLEPTHGQMVRGLYAVWRKTAYNARLPLRVMGGSREGVFPLSGHNIHSMGSQDMNQTPKRFNIPVWGQFASDPVGNSNNWGVTWEPATSSRPTATGSLKRRGPALPGFTNNTLPSIRCAGRCE